MTHKIITRRDFLKVASVAPLAGAILPALKAAPAGPDGKVKVILVRDPDALDAAGTPSAAVIQRMLDDAVTALVGEKDTAKAWQKIIRPDDVVGIKTNSWGNLPTPTQIEQAVKHGVMSAGVPEGRLSIDDRGVLRNPIFQNATALVNARPARVHQWAGMGSCIKNYIQFVPRPSDYHGDSCADLAAIWGLPYVKGKTRLNILVMLTPLFYAPGTIQYDKQYVWPYKGLIVSRDPVAADATGLRVLLAKGREHFGQEQPPRMSPHHIFLADTRHHLGVSGEDRIELVKLGWKDGVLI
jgi:hypothetical protein